MRAASFALVLVAWLATGIAPVRAQSKPQFSRSGAPNLFAFSAHLLRGNRVDCLVIAEGELCSDWQFWPVGSPNQYIFNSGIQVAGLIPATAAFPWAGDTVGAYFFDQRGTQVHGDRLTLLFSSRDTADLANWPPEALISDTSAFHASYLGRRSISDHDVWGKYWDGNPAFLSGRTHPVGIAVEQRALAWNYPEWNRDVVYFVLRLTNVTARNPAVYANAELAALGARFQDRSEATLGVVIPDDGYALDSVFVALGMDPDVGDAGHNNSSAVLPFETALAYKSNFTEPFFVFLPEIHGQPPFAAAPGFVGARFLRRPAPLRLYSEFTGSSIFPPPVGVRQLWRYLSGNLGAGDGPCTVANHLIRQVCLLLQTDLDTRLMMSHGPFSLAPGESRTIILSYFFAAPLDTVLAYQSTRLTPGIPFTGDSIAADPTQIRAVERAAGWLAESDANFNGVIEASEVVTAPRSLLHKAQLAQALADAKFLLPQAPVAPRFFLVPGDKRVTIVWQPSPTETAGDPYFPIAADRTSALYDPNFRRNDIEGYRIYRGTRLDRLELVVQFDYEGTQFRDFTGNLFYSGRCAPEIAVVDDCPVPFPAVPDTTVFADRELQNRLIQVPAGGRIESTNGVIVTLSADTVGGVGGTPVLNDTGVPFTFVDNTVSNGFTYFYAVTAFDVNSIRSGPAAMESVPTAQPTAPRVASGQTSGTVAPVLTLLGADGSVLDPTAPVPALNATTGIFTGPMPAADGLTMALDVFVPEVLGTGDVTLTIDSVIPGDANMGRPVVYFVRGQGAGPAVSLTIPIAQDFFSSDATVSASFQATTIDSAKAARFGADASFALAGSATVSVPGTWRLTSWGRGSVNADPPGSDFNGPRWWAGTANENTPDPNSNHCVVASTGCVQAPLNKTAGALPGVTTLFHPLSYSTVPSTPMRVIESVTAGVTRAADFRVHWGAAGAIDSVVDVTHGVRAPFADRIRASWGILRAASFTAVSQAATADGNNALLTWSDIACVAPVPSSSAGACTGAVSSPAVLLNSAALDPIAATASTYAATNTLTQTGTGFIFYLNGHFFLMQMAALPTFGSVWHARFYAGAITGTTGSYAFVPAVRPPAVPGLRARLSYSGGTLDLVRSNDSLLARVHTVPDPYYGSSAFETVADSQRLAFVNLPARAIIRIYSVSGILVAALIHNDATGGGEEYWNLRSRTGKAIASGVYFFHVETPDGRQKVGRFTVVNAFAR